MSQTWRHNINEANKTATFFIDPTILQSKNPSTLTIRPITINYFYRQVYINTSMKIIRRLYIYIYILFASIYLLLSNWQLLWSATRAAWFCKRMIRGFAHLTLLSPQQFCLYCVCFCLHASLPEIRTKFHFPFYASEGWLSACQWSDISILQWIRFKQLAYQ